MLWIPVNEGVNSLILEANNWAASRAHGGDRGRVEGWGGVGEMFISC